MDIQLYNTPAREKQKFEPINPGKVSLYSCGPTVYQYAHIGNMRSFLLSDILRRMFEYNGFGVKHVINITDVGHLVSDADEGEDKVEREAMLQGKSAGEIAAFYTNAFFKDIESLNIETSGTIFPKATEHIAEQINLIKQLEEKGFTYTTNDGVYFDTAQFLRYADFAHLDLKGMKGGIRVEANGEKRNHSDFALWKFSGDARRQQEWESPWGTGFPGWHIECSAMSMKYLGNHFDIHTGGVDHIAVHHTNEVAQSECATGEKFVNYWLHNEFILVDGQKMSKSLSNIFTLTDLKKHSIDPLAYRYWLLTAHYRTQVNFTWESVAGAQTALLRLRGQYRALGNDVGTVNKSYKDRFMTYINDDLDTPQALALVWELLKDEGMSLADKKATLDDFDVVLGIELAQMPGEAVAPDDVLALAEGREQARADKDWAKADELRAAIHEKGFEVEDTTGGYRITKK